MKNSRKNGVKFRRIEFSLEGLVGESFERITNEGENTHAKAIAGEIDSV